MSDLTSKDLPPHEAQDGSLQPSATNVTDIVHGVDMDHYRATVPLWKRVWHHSLTQMMLLSVQAFCGPAMSDAITGLGGGGLATPQVSNITNAITYAMLAIFCFFGGPIVNKIGVKWALVIGAATFPIQGSAYYCNSKFGNQWYLIFSGAISGIGTACWYVAEAGAVMTLAPSGARGKYLALWIVSRNLGQLVGGAINLSKNHIKGADGGVTPDTYIAFVIIECIALPFALLITPFERVVRSDGTRIVTAETLSTKMELKRIAKTMTSKLVMLSALWALWSFFYGGTWSTFLGTYFSVRARALSSLISPFFCIVGCFGLGFILDMKHLSQRRRAQLGLYTVVILNIGDYIWSITMQTKFDRHTPYRLGRRTLLIIFPALLLRTDDRPIVSVIYVLVDLIFCNRCPRSIEAIGQAIAYGMNIQTTSNPLVGFYVTFGLLAAALGPMAMLVNTTPDRISADVIAEQEDAAREKMEPV